MRQKPAGTYGQQGLNKTFFAGTASGRKNSNLGTGFYIGDTADFERGSTHTGINNMSDFAKATDTYISDVTPGIEFDTMPEWGQDSFSPQQVGSINNTSGIATFLSKAAIGAAVGGGLGNLFPAITETAIGSFVAGNATNLADIGDSLAGGGNNTNTGPTGNGNNLTDIGQDQSIETPEQRVARLIANGFQTVNGELVKTRNDGTTIRRDATTGDRLEDNVTGGAGNDILNGGTGNDVVTGTDDDVTNTGDDINNTGGGNDTPAWVAALGAAWVLDEFGNARNTQTGETRNQSGETVNSGTGHRWYRQRHHRDKRWKWRYN